MPEEYSARAILQLTQGYLFLFNMEDSVDSKNKKEITSLLCDKWNGHLVG